MEKKFKLFKIQTVNRQSTDGKSLRQYSVSTRLFRLAALFTLLFTIAVGQMWGYWYVPGNFYSEISFNTNCSQMSSDNYLTYYCIPPGTYQFKLAVDKNSSITWGNGTLTNGTPSIITELTSANTSYGDGGSGYNNTITVNQTCNIIFDVTQGDPNQAWACTVTAGAPTLPIKANFNNNGDWVWKTMQSNGDGTVSVKGLYGSCSGYDIRRTSREVEASWNGQNITTNISTTGTTPAASDNCVFTYDPSKGLAANASLTIRKANTITKNNYIYFDNKDAEWSDAHIYFVIGHAEYSKMYELTAITNTKLMRHINEADSWTDGSYYALAGGSSEWDKGTGWGYPSLLAWNHHTAAYTSAYNLRSGYYYIVGKENGDNGGAITLTEPGNAYTSLNSLTVGFKYAWDDDGDGTFTDMSSGTTPAQISMASYAFSNCSTVVANTAQTITANSSGTYSKSLANTAYRGKVTLTVSGVRDGWKFIGWYEGNTEKSTATSYTYYPNANTTITARFENRWSIKGTLKGQNWDVDNYITHFVQDGSGDEIGYWEETLTGNTNYVFKVVDRKDEGGWWTYSTVDATESDLTYAADNNAEHAFNSTGSHGNTKIYTAANGTYRFTWNATDHTLTVTYPNSYQVTYDGNGKSSGTLPTDNTYYASGETVTVAANGGSLTKTGYNTLAYWNTENDGSETDIAISTGTFSITDNTTLYAKWTQGVTLHDNNGAAHNGSTTVNWNAAGPFSITAPTRDHYSVEGYYAEVGCTNKVLTAAGAIAASSVVDGSSVTFISGSKWAHPAATTLYTKWTEDEYTVTTSSGEGGSVDAASYTAYVVTTTAISATPATGYKFLSWEVVSGSATFTDQYSASTTMNATSDAEIKANFVYQWSIAGSWLYYPETEKWDADTYAMGNITKDGDDDVCSVEVTLSANTNYTFKIADRAANPYEYLGNNTSTFYMTYGNSSNWTFGNDASNTAACGLTTAGAGTYTFTYNITKHKVSVTYPESFQVTAAGNPAAGGTVTPSSATYMSTSVGGEITATPNYSHYFNGWTSSAGGTFTNASAATTTFKPASAAATVTAAFAERTAFIEGNFQVYNSSRGTRTKTGDSWQDGSTNIKMTYDAVNNRYYLHTYSTPAELAAQLNGADAYFYVKTSTSSSSIANAATYKAYNSAAQSLSEYGSSHSLLVTTGESEHGFKFTGSEDGYVIIYFNGTSVWYELECALSYYGGDGATGDAPTERTYYAYNSSQTAASNSYSKTGYSFDHWDTAADDSGTDYAAGATNVAMNAREVCLHAMWTINNHDITYTAPSHGSYTIKAGDASAVSGNVDDVDYSTTVTLAATPASGYSFSSWSLTGATAADASSANTTFSMPDNDVTVAASFTEDKHTVTVEIGSAGGGVFSYGGSSSLTTKDISGIGISTATGDIVVDSLNPAWRFKKWEYDGAKITITTGGYTSKTIRVNATADATITAVFEPRFGLIGSLNEDGDPAGGMPNKDGKTWGNERSEDYEAGFEVFSFTAVGTGDGTGVDLRCTRTLESNKQYKFQIVDRATVGRDRFCLAADGSTLLEANGSITLNYKEQSNANVLINTIGYGEYTFRITNIAATTYNPTVTVDRPTDSKQLTLKCGYSIDAASSVTLSNDGGTAMGHTNEGGDGFDISDGGFFKSGSYITFTATPATGYVFEGWYTDNTYGTCFATDNPMTMTKGTNANVTVYARFIEKTNTFTDGASTGYWNNTSNWSLGSLPTINERVVITKPVTVDIAHAVAKRIILDQSDSKTGKLTIQANKGLEVAGTVQVYDGSSYNATTPADLVLESSASGNATLIFDNSNFDQATVQMYSKGWTTGTQNSGTWNWQMIGTPVTDATRINDYYDGYMYKWSSGWVDMTDFSETLTPFAGYSATYPTTSDKLHTYSIDGTLVPTGDKSIDIPTGTSVYAVANSWTAPIYVKNITFSSEPANVYIFNTGFAASKAASGDRWTANTYHAVPVSSSPYTGDSLIASMQGFFVKTTSGTMTINYDDVVRPTGTRNINADEMHAPKRAMAAEPAVLKIYVSDSLYDDRVVLLARNDFSRGFDNGWDGEKFQINAVKTAPRLFAINETGGKDEVSAIPELENTVIGFRPGKEETYTIHFDYNGDETLYLRDTRTGAETLITNESEYVFLSDGTNEDARFIISRVQSTPTGVEETGAGSKAYKLMIEDHIYIIRDGRMYSVDGALVK